MLSIKSNNFLYENFKFLGFFIFVVIYYFFEPLTAFFLCTLLLIARFIFLELVYIKRKINNIEDKEINNILNKKDLVVCKCEGYISGAYKGIFNNYIFISDDFKDLGSTDKKRIISHEIGHIEEDNFLIGLFSDNIMFLGIILLYMFDVFNFNILIFGIISFFLLVPIKCYFYRIKEKKADYYCLRNTDAGKEFLLLLNNYRCTGGSYLQRIYSRYPSH